MAKKCRHCGSKAIVTSSNQITDDINDQYVHCVNPECSATMVYRTCYLHDTQPPLKTTQQLAAALIKSLPIEERQALQRDMFSN